MRRKLWKEVDVGHVLHVESFQVWKLARAKRKTRFRVGGGKSILHLLMLLEELLVRMKGRMLLSTVSTRIYREFYL